MAARSLTVKLNNGIKMPQIGLGTYLIKDGEVCKTVVREALSSGYRHIDTAAAYQNEQFIGEVVADLGSLGLSRDQIWITTKVPPSYQGRDKCRECVLESLKKLRTPYVDLVLIHWPGVMGAEPEDARHSQLRKESWQDLEQLVSEGKVRSIGVSNYMIAHLDELLSHAVVPPAVNQVEFHPLLFQKDLLDFCNAKGIHLQAYSSLGSAKGYETLSNKVVVKRIADECSRSVPQVLLRWALQHGVGIIPKTSRVANLVPNIDLDFVLGDSAMKELDSLNADTHFCWDPNKIK